MTVLDNQSTLDIATQEFGTLEQLFVLLNDNNISVNAKLLSGQELVINKTNVGDEEVKDFISLNEITMNNDQGQSLPPLIGGDFNNDFNNDFN